MVIALRNVLHNWRKKPGARAGRPRTWRNHLRRGRRPIQWRHAGGKHCGSLAMNIVQITPGAGGMFCGNCLRDNALVAALRKFGHQVLMVPLYLPMTLDEEDQSAGTPIFFNGVNVYLEQKSPFFRHAPGWLHRVFASPWLLRWAAGRAARTRAEELGDLTISMLRGEEGNQSRELNELIGWLQGQPHPGVICL